MKSCLLHVNKRTGFSSWTVAAGAHADEVGCVIRVSSLTEDDYTHLAMAATEEEINAAKANPTPEAISALIDKYQASPLARAIAAAEEYEAFLGTGLGRYNNEAGDFADKLADARALLNNPDATEDQKTAAIAAIAVSTLHINQPVPGHFYRFHYGNKYLSSTIHETRNENDEITLSRFAIETEANADNLNNTTVFYFDGTHLVTYPGGLVMGNMVVDTTHLKGVLVSDTAGAGTIRFAGSAFEKGKYNIISDTNTRYLYHRDSYADSGNSGAANSNDTGYRWEITEVTYLPVPYSGTGHFHVCAPVELDITQWNHATPFIGVLQGDKVGKKTMDSGILPANTPAILQYVGGISHNCVYFRISGYPEIAPAAEDATNSLTNTGVYATAKEADQSYFTVSGDNFVPYTGDTLPAFAAVLKVPTVQANPDGYAIAEYNPDYVSITEIESAGNNGKQVIYDLQGRRVQRASKGLYIINGVKTLVK